MAYSVPTKSSLMGAAKGGGLDGTALALGETMGRSLLGAGVGTAVGGLAVASAQSGASRDTMATIAAERGMSELFAGGGGGGGGGSRGSI